MACSRRRHVKRAPLARSLIQDCARSSRSWCLKRRAQLPGLSACAGVGCSPPAREQPVRDAGEEGGLGDVWVRQKCKDVCSGATVASRGDALSALLGARDEGAERTDAAAQDRAAAAEQRARERVEAAEGLVADTATAAARSASAARDAMLSLHAAFEHAAAKSRMRDVRKAAADSQSHASASEEAARQALRGVAGRRDHS